MGICKDMHVNYWNGASISIKIKHVLAEWELI